MIVRLGLLAVVLACAVAPAGASVRVGDAPVDGEQVVRSRAPRSAALVPLSGVVLVGGLEEASPAQGAAGAGRRGETDPRRDLRTVGLWTPTRPAVGAGVRRRVLRL